MISNWNVESQQRFSLLCKRMGDDVRILPIHLGLTMALLYHHNGDLFADCFHASRRKLMVFSGIKSVTTYHKYLTELVRYGYLAYTPSWHPTKASCFKFIEAEYNEQSNSLS